MKYLKYFKTESEYTGYKNGSEFVLPNVSYVEETKGVSYDPAIMNYPDIILQEGNTYPEVGARLSQMLNKYITKYNRNIIQSPYDEPNKTTQFEIFLDYEINEERFNLIGFYKLDPDGNPISDESIDLYDSLVEDDDCKYLKSLKCLTKYGDIIDVGLHVCFYPSSCDLEGCNIDFDGTLYFYSTPEPA
jgi:hypothetical protein